MVSLSLHPAVIFPFMIFHHLFSEYLLILIIDSINSLYQANHFIVACKHLFALSSSLLTFTPLLTSILFVYLFFPS